MKTSILLNMSKSFDFGGSAGYIIGAIIALFIVIYLIYTLLRPEKL